MSTGESIRTCMNLSFHISRPQLIVIGIVAYLHLDLIAPNSLMPAKAALLVVIDCAAVFFLFHGRPIRRFDSNAAQVPAITVLPGNVIRLSRGVRADELARTLRIPLYQLVKELMAFDVFAAGDTILNIDLTAKIARGHGWEVSDQDRIDEP